MDHAYLIVDSSSSVEADFAVEKAVVKSFVGAMPNGAYHAGAINFGGTKREGLRLSPFDRSRLEHTADTMSHLGEGTPLDLVIRHVGNDLSGKSGHAAIVVFSDGFPTDPVGRAIDHELVLDAARYLARSYDGDVCIHTVQVGDDPEGAEFLEKLAATSGCGSSRSLGSIQNAAALQSFERDVFLAPDTPGSGQSRHGY